MKNSKVLTKLRSKVRGQIAFVCDQSLNKTLNSGRQIQSHTNKRFAKTELYLLALRAKPKVLQRNATQRNATQRNAAQRNAAQRNATQRNATQHTQKGLPLQDRVTKLNRLKIKQVIFQWLKASRSVEGFAFGEGEAFHRSTEAPTKSRALTVRFSNNSFRQREKYKMIRPLLDFKRETITMVCKDFKMPVYPDQSNRSIQYSRNRIRKQIIPSIKYFLNPQLENSLFKMAELLNKEQFFLCSILKNSSIQ